MADEVATPILVFEDPPAPAGLSAFLGASPGASRSTPPAAAADLAGAAMALLAGVAQENRGELRALLKALIAEGRRFSETPAGRRWTAILADSALVRNGWLLWNQANVDFYLRNAPTPGDDPGAMLEDVLRRLADTDLAALLAQLRSATIAADLAAAAKERP